MNDISTDTARNLVLRRLQADLSGPSADDEILGSRPSDVYLTGILWPGNTGVAPEEDERLAVAPGESDEGDDAEDQALPASVPLRRPSTAGLSFAAAGAGAGETPSVSVHVAFGLYEPTEVEGTTRWRRTAVQLPPLHCILEPGAQDHELAVPGIVGLRLNLRCVPYSEGILATATLVNGTVPASRTRDDVERVTLFQTGLRVSAADGSRLLARPSRRAVVDDDDRSAALLYRNVHEYAAGHTCSADWESADDGGTHVTEVRTTWMPVAVTPATSPDGHEVFRNLSGAEGNPLSAAWLASASDSALAGGLARLCDAYAEWAELQAGAAAGFSGEEADTAARHLDDIRAVLTRMRAGAVRIADDARVAAAFRLANLAMDTQRTWSGADPLRWRPFQLGFLLLALESTLDGTHGDRGVMDLLWFPTGGGKTEAYLGLVALVAFHRRLSSPNPDDGAGVACIMRYTLRLLTTQQFIRAAAVICACEAIRRGRVPSPDAVDLGSEPFSIGLWVGEGATPNNRKEAFSSWRDSSKASPRQLVSCPCCHTLLDYTQRQPADAVTLSCSNAVCLLSGADPLPVWTVDEDVYAARPTMLIGTVDKFAQIVRNPETSFLFGVGSSAQPQLVLQDELHLISGPLGTLAGLYETALDLILSANGTRPKVIGSTATIRRASDQVLALFDRRTCQFPPPGLDAADSGFAVTDPDAPGRCYVGVSTAGRSAKFTLQAVAASLLQTATGLPEEERDPYWTLVAYFNSLRELGGALVLMQDDVNDTLRLLAASRNETPREPASVEELTSRRSQQDIRDMLARLDVAACGDGALDVVLATSMLSVGVDIPRLGLMLVNGQPKTLAEYIQSTSRVGRGRVAGLVVPVLNNAKPRDRSHFETFRTWHSMLYRDVEATSVTPFASRARDRALHAVLVAVVRHLVPGMLRSPQLGHTAVQQARDLIDLIAERASRVDPQETDVRTELSERLARWIRRHPDHYWQLPLQSLLQSAEAAAAKRASGRAVGQAWPTPNTMRGVEPATPYRLAERLRRSAENATE
jgi:hypothetical protein